MVRRLSVVDDASVKKLRKFYSGQGLRIIHVVVLALLLILAGRISVHRAAAQGFQWSPPRVIPAFDPDSWPPILIADQHRTVHAFSSQWVGEEGEGRYRAIVYNQWTLARGWTNPTDIILSPSKEARLTDVHLDTEGTFHVVFWGGDGTAADIYYSRANSRNVDEVQSWDPPVVVAENAGDPEAAVLAEDDQGDLLIVYHGKIYGNGVYVIRSQDGGSTWSRPVQIFLANAAAPNVWYINVIRSNSGWLHAVWNVYNIAGQGRGIYYARSRDGFEWSDPVLLADAREGLGTMTPTIVEYQDALFVIYNLPPKIRMRRSMDDGVTWADLVTLFPRHVGVNGSLSTVVDGNDTLHLFFGQRIDATLTSPAIHGMWHSIWVGNRWVEPEAVVKGPQVADRVGDKSFDPYEARAVVSQGNVILATWRTDPGLKENGMWYSYKILDIPELPVTPQTAQPLPEPISTSMMPSGTVSGPDETATAGPLENQPLLAEPYSPSVAWSSSTLMVMGAMPAIILVLALVIIRMSRNKPS
jgi:hypothetical protein